MDANIIVYSKKKNPMQNTQSTDKRMEYQDYNALQKY